MGDGAGGRGEARRQGDEADGIVNKQMGDGLMAIFNFPIKVEHHAEAAVTSAPGSSDTARSRSPTSWALG